jgi:hypothetical protein
MGDRRLVRAKGTGAARVFHAAVTGRFRGGAAALATGNLAQLFRSKFFLGIAHGDLPCFGVMISVLRCVASYLEVELEGRWMGCVCVAVNELVLLECFTPL